MRLKLASSGQTPIPLKMGLCVLLALTVNGVCAQAVYRIVGPDGRVSFSDKPPASGAAPVSSGNGAAAKTTENNATTAVTLPYELRQTVNKYPVTLYTSGNCGPCGAGRALLNQKGIPFSEKTVNTVEDAQELMRISGESSLPFLTIGAQQIKGYSETEWTQFLNAAGYPPHSGVPSGYRNAPPSPLVAIQKQAPSPKTEERPSPRALAEPTPPPVDRRNNPAGIQF